MKPTLLLASLCIRLTLAIGDNASYCCTALINAGLQNSLILPSAVHAYYVNVQHYFSQTAELSPQCFFQPQNTTEVSLAVSALVSANKTSPCPFAIRSGGHMHFPGAAGIENGVTFDMSQMKDITYYADNSSLSVGPGAVWGDVYQVVDKAGVMVTGGRSSSVGVGGLTVGGGNSFWAARKGFVCDNVLQFEVVLADGSIIVAHQDFNSDLFQALKGGSNNFGIVTRFDFETFEGGNLFGGVVVYPGETADQQFAALTTFADEIDQDPYSSVIVISFQTSDSENKTMFMNAYDYTKRVLQPESKTFDAFFAIPGNISDSTGLRNMTSLAEEFEQGGGSRVSFSTLTFKNDIRVLKKAHEAFQTVAGNLAAQAQGEYGFYTLYQPIPQIIAKVGNQKGGGNVLGLDRFHETLIMYEPYLKWEHSEQDAFFQSQAQWLRDEISSYAQSIGASNEWLYLNYADQDQRPLEGYGVENVAKIAAVAQNYDPNGVFQYMVPGGFKISDVSYGPDDIGTVYDSSAAGRNLWWTGSGTMNWLFGRM